MTWTTAKLYVMSENALNGGWEKIPLPFLMNGLEGMSDETVVWWIWGGCKMSPELQALLIPYFSESTKNALSDTLIISGGTRSPSGTIMVTDLPWVIKESNPNANIRLIATTPKTSTLSVNERIGWGLDFNVSAYDHINMDYEEHLIVQPNAADNTDRDGDVPVRFTCVENMKSAGYPIIGTFIDGGGVTEAEIEGFVQRGRPTILVQDDPTSWRATNKAIAKYRDLSHVFVASLMNPASMTEAGIKAGIFRAISN